jgi:hypothetical protein
MVPTDVIAKQVARHCLDKPQWKWEAVPHGEQEFLISFPSFEELDKVDGIQVGVPSFNSKISISAWQSAEVPHKIELEQVWLHVDGVPHTVRHFLGLRAVGSLMGKTLDVDLLSLRCHGVVRILVAMFDSKLLKSKSDEFGHFVNSDVVVKLKGYEFRFRREPAEYIPEPDFVPFIWRQKDEGGGDDGANGKDPDDAMDTSDSLPAPSGTVLPIAQTGTSTTSHSGVSRSATLQMVVTPFNPNPQTPKALEVVEKLRKTYPWLEATPSPR